MSAEKEDDNSFDLKFLNKKRSKSKAKRKRDNNNIHRKKEIDTLSSNNNFDEKNIDNAEKNIKHFFHFNWDDDNFEKESTQINKYITGPIFWYLINSSYFTENNNEKNVENITKKYLETGSINNNKNETKIEAKTEQINNEKNSLNKSNNIINKIDKNNLDLPKTNKISISEEHFYSIINFLNCSKTRKYFFDVFGHEEAKEYLHLIKKNIIYFIQILNKRNQEKIKKLLQKSKEIQSKYDAKNNKKILKNNIITDNEELDENYLYSKNEKSYNIRNKFWNYLYEKEKDFLMKREGKNYYREIDYKDEEREDNFFIDACNICNVEDLGIYNNLYECTQCGVKVHPLCYRMKSNPDPHKWKCAKCKLFPAKEACSIECILCPVKGGAMQRTKISKDGRFYKEIMKIRKNDEINYFMPEYITTMHNTIQDCPWVHLSCALWNNDVKIDIYDKKKSIKFEENNIIQNYRSYCFICKLNNFGPTIKCKVASCIYRCHPECARINDYYFEMDYCEKAMNFSFYCHEHRPNRFIKYLNKSIKNINDEIFSFSNVLNYVYQLYKRYELKDFIPKKIGELEESDENDDSEEKERRIRNIMNKRSKSRYRLNKKFVKKVKKESSDSEKELYIDLKNNNINNINKIPDKNDININMENIITNNCVSSIKINNNENEKFNQFNLINMNSSNESNNSIKSNNSHNYSNSSENNKLSTKIESLTPTAEDQKEEFAQILIRHLRNYFTKYRIFLIKGDSKYSQPEENEEIDEFLKENLKNVEFDDLKNGKYDIKKMESKKEFNKKYRTIYKSEEEFIYYYKRKLDDNYKETANIGIENIELKKEEIKYDDYKIKKNLVNHEKKYFKFNI